MIIKQKVTIRMDNKFVNSIYLAGGMTGLTFEESNGWRKYLSEKLEHNTLNPNDYFNPHESNHGSEKEARNYDLMLLKKCDLVIVNFNTPNSIGTAQELAVAYENHIPVIGVNENKYELHPWLVECCERIFSSIDELIEYVNYYY